VRSSNHWAVGPAQRETFEVVSKSVSTRTVAARKENRLGAMAWKGKSRDDKDLEMFKELELQQKKR
jgi:hypothetical protein